MRGLSKFDPSKPAIANQEFVFAGRTFSVGDEFPHAVFKLDRTALGGLWQTGRIRFVDTPPTLTDAELERLTAPAGPPQPVTIDHSHGKTETVMMPPGHPINVRTPAQQASDRAAGRQPKSRR